MSIATSADLLSASLLRAGLGPLQKTADTWTCTTQPTQDSPGFDVEAYAVAAVQLAPSGASPGRRIRVRLGTFDAASTYTLVVGGVTVTSAAPASVSALWAAIVAWAAPTGYTITGVDTNGDATSVAADRRGVDIVGPPSATVSWTATSGSPVLSTVVDAVQFLARTYTRRRESAYGTLAGDDSTGWAKVDEVVVDADGAERTVDVGRATSCRVWVTSATASGSDACSPGAVTVYTPVAIVLPATTGASR